MKLVGRVIAALLTIAFGVLAIPFLLLTAGQMLSGGPVGLATIAVFLVYSIVLIVVVFLWIRRLGRRRRGEERL